MLSSLLFAKKAPTWSLTTLPEDFLMSLFFQLKSVRDIVALQSTCKQMRSLGRSRVVWADRLKKEYGMDFQVSIFHL